MMKKTTTLLLLLSGITLSSHAVQLATWTAAPAQGASGSVWAPTTTASNVTVTDFTKGAGVNSGGSLAGGSWGGSGGWSSAPTAGNTNGALYFTIKANTGYTVSLSSIPTFVTRRSGSGPQTAAVLYSLNGGSTFTPITSISTTATQGNGSNSTNATLTNLTAITALQNVPSSTTIMIKVVPSGSNNWYIMYVGGGFILEGTVNNAPLPVTLSSFTANRSGNKVSLSWETSFEHNTSHYELEKSADGTSYSLAGRILAVNDKDGHSYAYTDDAATAKAYYRLKIVDFDGSFEYSKVVAVTGMAAQSKAVLLQNPVETKLSLSVSGQMHYTIIGLEGATVQSGTINREENGSTTIDISRMGKGLYLLRLQNMQGQQVLKFVKE